MLLSILLIELSSGSIGHRLKVRDISLCLCLTFADSVFLASRHVIYPRCYQATVFHRATDTFSSLGQHHGSTRTQRGWPHCPSLHRRAALPFMTHGHCRPGLTLLSLLDPIYRAA